MTVTGCVRRFRLSVFLFLAAATNGTLGYAQSEPSSKKAAQFPVKPTPLVRGTFNRSEGIAFNGEGDLYVTANAALWRVGPDGDVTRVTRLYSNLGVAAIGERDLLVADFGPTNAFAHGKNDDGIVWRVTPEGQTSIAAKGIGDPNFILVLKDGSFLVSDDATDEVFKVTADGDVGLFTTAVKHPNGLALSRDGSTLYIAQIFQGIRPIVPDNRVWALALENGQPKGAPEVIATTGQDGANDGLAMDELGRVYIAANGEGKIWRFDPRTQELIVIAERMPGAASIAFGQGAFDPHAIYVTSTRQGGGTIWKVDVGVKGTPLFR
jgi:sugar lactone lactonase YvrE